MPPIWIGIVKSLFITYDDEIIILGYTNISIYDSKN